MLSLRHHRTCTVLLIMGLIQACGDGPTGPDNGDMSALVDGIPWEAASAQVERTPGVVTITGSTLDLAIGLRIADNGPGTYSVDAAESTRLTVTGTDRSLIDDNVPTFTVWFADGRRGSGTVEVSIFDDSRVAGTFEFEAPGAPGSSATGTRTVAGGTFDVRF